MRLLKLEADHVCFVRGREAARARGANSEAITTEENMFAVRKGRADVQTSEQSREVQVPHLNTELEESSSGHRVRRISCCIAESAESSHDQLPSVHSWYSRT